MPPAEEEKCCQVVVVKPECIASAEETEVTTNMHQGLHAGAACCQKQTDLGATLKYKSSCRVSMY